jgi:zinc ribbon protein
MSSILIFAVLLGLIPAAIAQHKGHPFLTWWLFGALLLIVALPWSLVLRDERRKCPYCAEPIKGEAQVCPHCQRELTPAAA